MKEFWNERYSGNDYAYGESPNRFFERELPRFSPGHVLLPGEGEGRNAVWAARQGWQVSALDYSEEARKKALALGKKYNVAIDYSVTDLLTTSLPENHYDLIVLIFLHLPKTFRSAFHEKVIRALKPGGHLLAELFSTEQLKYGTGGPQKEEMLVTMDELQRDFSSLQILQLEQTETELNEGAYHKGQANVIRLIAQKP